MSDIEKKLKTNPFTARSFKDMDSVVDFEVYKEKVSLALDEIKKLQAENAELKKQNKWISVDDELPEFNTVVLVKVYRERGISWPEADYSCTAKLPRVVRHCGENSPVDNRWYVFPSGGTEITRDVTHWMPLPTPPKVE